MGLPTQYLTSTKNLAAVFEAIRNAKAPEKFTIRFLESLGFKSNSDRLIIGILKALGFLDDAGKPKDRYYEFLDDTRWEAILAEAVEETYSELFQVNKNAHTMSSSEVINKIKTISQGAYSEAVLKKMSMTFAALAKLGDFTGPSKKVINEASGTQEKVVNKIEVVESNETAPTGNLSSQNLKQTLGGLHYNIQLILPESRDPKVYDVLFKSLKEHLIE